MLQHCSLTKGRISVATALPGSLPLAHAKSSITIIISDAFRSKYFIMVHSFKFLLHSLRLWDTASFKAQLSTSMRVFAQLVKWQPK